MSQYYEAKGNKHELDINEIVTTPKSLAQVIDKRMKCLSENLALT